MDSAALSTESGDGTVSIDALSEARCSGGATQAINVLDRKVLGEQKAGARIVPKFSRALRSAVAGILRLIVDISRGLGGSSSDLAVTDLRPIFVSFSCLSPVMRSMRGHCVRSRCQRSRSNSSSDTRSCRRILKNSGGPISRPPCSGIVTDRPSLCVQRSWLPVCRRLAKPSASATR